MDDGVTVGLQRPQTTTDDKLVLDVPETARRLRISRSFAYELIAAGKLPSSRLGRRVLVPVRELDEFLARHGEIV